jgi:hypothetical protein
MANGALLTRKRHIFATYRTLSVHVSFLDLKSTERICEVRPEVLKDRSGMNLFVFPVIEFSRSEREAEGRRMSRFLSNKGR